MIPAVMVVICLAALWLTGTEPSGRGRSWDANRQCGRWRVRYPDGEVSHNMCRDVAEDYALLFGGRVESAPPEND